MATLTAEQASNAATIYQVGYEVGASPAEIQAAVATALMESNLRAGATGDGGNAVGLFQQWPSYGTEQVRRNPVQAARAFFQRLLGTDESLPVDVRVGNVQRPAGWSLNPADQERTGDRYEAFFPQARSALQSLDLGTAPDYGSADSVAARGNGGVTVVPGAVTQDGGINLTGVGTPVFGVLRGIDDVLNNTGGLTDPFSTARAVVARGAVAAVGVTVATFGLILVVTAVLKSKPAREVTNAAKFIPGPTSVAAVAADAVNGGE